MSKFNIGDEVFWTDPHNGISNGFYEIIKIISKDIYYIKNKYSEAEVFEHELT